jgi:hypothetical protein
MTKSVFWALGQSGCSKKEFFFLLPWGKKRTILFWFFFGRPQKKPKNWRKKIALPNQIATLPNQRISESN